MRRLENGTIVMGIDHGYGYIKTANTSFMAGVTELKGYIGNECVGMHLSYNGADYAIGETRNECIFDKTQDQNYYLLTLTAIATELFANGIKVKEMGWVKEDVILAVGLPISDIASSQKFIAYLKQQGNVQFVYNGVNYDICIKDVVCYPQGYAIIAPARSKYPSGMICVDVGTWTLDIIPWADGAKPLATEAESINFGVLKCVLNIQKYVRAKTGVTLKESQIQPILMEQQKPQSPLIAQAISEACQKYASDVIAALSDRGYSPLVNTFVFMGGGASILKKYMRKDEFSDMAMKPLYITDSAANAKGYEILAFSMEKAKLNKERADAV